MTYVFIIKGETLKFDLNLIEMLPNRYLGSTLKAGRPHQWQNGNAQNWKTGGARFTAVALVDLVFRSFPWFSPKFA